MASLQLCTFLDMARTRRSVLAGTAGTVLGLSALQRPLTGARQDGSLRVVAAAWIPEFHPRVKALAGERGASLEPLPEQGFGTVRLTSETKTQRSTWDLFLGMTPFMEMQALVDAGSIEPWDPWLPAGMLDDIPEPIRAECSIGGRLYSWPLLHEPVVIGWNAGVLERAGLDTEPQLSNWDDLYAMARQAVDSGASPFGAMFDANAWRSLIPIAHGFGRDLYREDGAFRWDGDAALAALEVLMRLRETATSEITEVTPTSCPITAFDEEKTLFLISHAADSVLKASAWDDPSLLRFSPLPAPSTVFWTTGAALMTYGEHKAEAADFLAAMQTDDAFWRHNFLGDPAQMEVAVGQLPVLNSWWAAAEATPPNWINAVPWAPMLHAVALSGRCIEPTLLGSRQFYAAFGPVAEYLNGNERDPKAALAKAQRIVDDLLAAEAA